MSPLSPKVLHNFKAFCRKMQIQSLLMHRSTIPRLTYLQFSFKTKHSFFSRLHHCMARGWLRFGLNGDMNSENHLNIQMTNVAGNSPVFQLWGI